MVGRYRENSSLSVIGLGEVTISREMLNKFGVSEDSVIHVTITLGSITVSLDIDDKAVTGSDSAHPVHVVYPYDKIISSNTVIYDTANGDVLPFCVRDDTANMIFLTPYFGTFEAKDNPKSFTDIADHWAEDDIAFTTARELFNGYGNGIFAPDDTMTRAMVVTVLGRMWRVDTADYAQSRFSDVDIDTWYGPYVEWASQSGVVNGMGDGTFDPEAAVTREQLATILARFVAYSGLELTQTVDDDQQFADQSSISSWAVECIDTIKGAGIIEGKLNNLFDPQGNATRAEVSAIFRRYIENIVK